MLVSKDDFIGLSDVVHLCAGGETPILKTHQEAVSRFFNDKPRGEKSRDLMQNTYLSCKAKAGRLLDVSPEEIAFLSSTSDGVNLLAHALDWNPGDNVVVADLEFPSDILPWSQLKHLGVELRLVPHDRWRVSVSDLESSMDSRTRVVAVSLVSFLTGQRLPLKELSQLVRSTQALLSVDATHAAGVVPIEARCADILMSSCYKWLLGVHGVSLFYWNRNRLPDLEPPFLGWHTPASFTSWQAPTSYQLRSGADRFEPGNPAYIAIYILDNALEYLWNVGGTQIEKYILDLGDILVGGLTKLGVELMTPIRRQERAGNVCFFSQKSEALMSWLGQRGILVWGDSQRVRVSTHLYNTRGDVKCFLESLSNYPDLGLCRTQK